MRRAARRAVAAAAMLSGAGMADPPTVTSVSPPRVLLGPRWRGLEHFPDGPLDSAVVAGRTLYFAANGGRRSAPDHGTIGLVGPLDALAPLIVSGAGEPAPSFHPPPAGREGGFAAQFDRDYAGGGPMVWDPASSLLLHAYHAEHHPEPDRPLAFYASVGLAVSRDRGSRFERLGLIVRPERGPDAGVPTPISAGSFVAAGEQLRLYYSDIGADGLCDGVDSGGLPCLAVAQASLADVVAAARDGRTPLFQKWFRGAFSEPGVGGRFTPLVTTGARLWVRWPSVARDPASGAWFLAYAAGAAGLELRTSQDGLTWSPPAHFLATRPDEAVNYPSILEVACDEGPSGCSAFHAKIVYVSLPRRAGVVDFASRRLLQIAVGVTLPDRRP